MAQYDPKTGVATGRFLLRGERVPDLVKNGFELKSPLGEVSHHFAQPKSTQLIVAFELKTLDTMEARECPLQLWAQEPPSMILEIPGSISAPVTH